ncbi:hypothetical protein Acr_29g0012040 [Actinidia rufa]|uniref:XS domain-containing protein n=1 Tax=Actinidia rufa TaxID=165716 RepID=A0A7J0HG83_9ERIC|nr:hypothetical protein Acr_29g0012040 [Actinidia rufa]
MLLGHCVRRHHGHLWGDLGIVGGKARTLYAKAGHLGILVMFTGDQSGLKEAVRLAEFFEREKHGRKNWTLVQSLTSDKNEENNPSLMKVDEKTGEKTKILYGFLGTAADLDKGGL